MDTDDDLIDECLYSSIQGPVSSSDPVEHNFPNIPLELKTVSFHTEEALSVGEGDLVSSERANLQRPTLTENDSSSDYPSVPTDAVASAAATVSEDVDDDSDFCPEMDTDENDEASPRKHRGRKVNRCRQCGRIFDLYKDLYRHFREHFDQLPLKCEHCEYATDIQRSLAQHIKSHESDRQYQCHLCSAAFNSKARLRRHHVTHTGEKKFQCSDCDVKFTQKKSMDEHWNRFHSGQGKTTICPVCHKRLARPNFLPAHISNQHSTANGPWPCFRCRTPFETKHELKVHSIKCRTINKRRHVSTTQRGDLFYLCPLCYIGPCGNDKGKTYFASLTNLKSHLRKVHSARPGWCRKYVRLPLLATVPMMAVSKFVDCKKCDDDFSAFEIEDHARLHPDSQDWRCNLCSSKSTEYHSLASMDHHLKSVHDFERSILSGNTVADHSELTNDSLISDPISDVHSKCESLAKRSTLDSVAEQPKQWLKDLREGFGFLDDDDMEED